MITIKEVDQVKFKIFLLLLFFHYSPSPLRNPLNDARDMSNSLIALGFKVTTLINANQQEMFYAIRDFGENLVGSEVGLFYFAGHGMQVSGVNYLIPIGADIQAEEEVRISSIDASFVLSKMEPAGTLTNLVILDACRDNPFACSFRSSSRGLAIMDAPRGSLIVYATAPGSVAADGTGRNGIVTGSLLKYLKTPDLDVEDMLRAVRKDVINATKG